MGLDIRAYNQIEFVCEGSALNVESPEAKGLVYLYAFPGEIFQARADGFKDGFYKVHGAQLIFRAGSYSGYNQWRNILSEIMLGTSANSVWETPKEFEGYPFYELINFADNEGIIGPKTSMKLSLDFEMHREKIAERARFQMWILETYDHFAEAFKLASDNGVVEFT